MDLFPQDAANLDPLLLRQLAHDVLPRDDIEETVLKLFGENTVELRRIRKVLGYSAMPLGARISLWEKWQWSHNLPLLTLDMSKISLISAASPASPPRDDTDRLRRL
jgi:hypothetical protein